MENPQYMSREQDTIAIQIKMRPLQAIWASFTTESIGREKPPLFAEVTDVNYHGDIVLLLHIR